VKHLIVTVLVLLSLTQAASLSDVRAWRPGKDNVGVTAVLHGKFSSVFLGSIDELLRAASGGEFHFYYRVEVRREIPYWPDETVASDVYTYTVDFPAPGEDRPIDVMLSSSSQGRIATASCTSGEEALNMVRNLGCIGGHRWVILYHSWEPDERGHNYHARVRASMDVPFELDPKTEWADSPSFSVSE